MKKKKQKAKPTSVRLEPELLQDLNKRCNELGCSRNDFIRSSVEFSIYEADSIESDENDNQDQESKPIPKAKVIKMSDDDGKTWYDVSEIKDPKIVEI